MHLRKCMLHIAFTLDDFIASVCLSQFRNLCEGSVSELMGFVGNIQGFKYSAEKRDSGKIDLRNGFVAAISFSNFLGCKSSSMKSLF